MIKKASLLLSSFTAKNMTLSEQEENILQYTLEIILSKFLFSFCIIAFGFFTHRFFISFLYLLTFSMMRSFGGGAHASGRLKCALLSYGIGFAAIFLTPIICNALPNWVLFCMYSVFNIYSLFIAPVDTKNKRITGQKRSRMRYKFLLCSLVLTLLYSVLFLLDYKSAYGIISVCVMIFGISLIIGKLQNRKDFNNEF